MAKKTKPLYGKELVDVIVAAAEEKKAERIAFFDMGKTESLKTWYIVCESDNPVHVRSVADGIEEACLKHNTKPWRSEGQEEGRWALLDFSDVVVHVMLGEVRRYYSIEELWEQSQKNKTSK